MTGTGQNATYLELSPTILPTTADRMVSFREHVERCILLSCEKQEKLRSLAGEHLLHMDLDAGTVRFSEALSVPFQVLGTESENTLTWLWAWADEQTDIPHQLIRSSLEMRAWLQQEGLNDVSRPSVDLDLADGTMLSAVATTFCKASAFYRDPYEGGALYLLLFSRDIDRQPDLNRTGLIRILGELVAMFDLDLKNVVRSYFLAKGLPCSESAETVNAQMATGERVILEFDDNASKVMINGEPLV